MMFLWASALAACAWSLAVAVCALLAIWMRAAMPDRRLMMWTLALLLLAGNVGAMVVWWLW